MSEVEEILAEQIHKAYCRFKKEVHNEDYWTGGDYSKLADEWKEADRYMARVFLEWSQAKDAEIARLEAQNQVLVEALEHQKQLWDLVKPEIDYNDDVCSRVRFTSLHKPIEKINQTLSQCPNTELYRLGREVIEAAEAWCDKWEPVNPDAEEKAIIQAVEAHRKAEAEAAEKREG